MARVLPKPEVHAYLEGWASATADSQATAYTQMWQQGRNDRKKHETEVSRATAPLPPEAS